MNKDQQLDIFKTASLCRNFEERVFNLIQKKTFKYPLYLSAGEEYISATLSNYYKDQQPLIFAQHRAHSTYLSFKGNIDKLIKELLGKEDGCAGGMGGSASICSTEIGMFGHDGLMGSQIPIAVGACLTSNKLTLAICGDASAEEDYVMSAIAWAGTKKIPILFIVEDNNLSILTEKKVRRDWEMDSFARSVGVNAENITDNPKEIYNALDNLSLPALLNIRTDRLFWHAGAGIDEHEKIDRYKLQMDELGDSARNIHDETKTYINQLWDLHLESR
jgi:TPP-dependent pyruvate/acetoin dehydrogenase alpha subunit